MANQHVPAIHLRRIVLDTTDVLKSICTMLNVLNKAESVHAVHAKVIYIDLQGLVCTSLNKIQGPPCDWHARP
jgi:hypothetical protein